MRRWRILSIGNTDLYLHPAMLLYALYAILTGHGTFMGISTLSILLHETAHAIAAAAMGQIPTRIELTPLGAVMHLEEDGKLPQTGRIIMLLAGPVMTFLLCVLAVKLTATGKLPMTYGRLLFMSNLSILLLNLLPVLPLDGGKLLSVILEFFLPHRIVCRILQWIGGIIGTGLIVLNIYASWKLGGWNLSLAFAGCCLLYSSAVSTTTVAVTELRQFMDRKIMLEQKGSMKTARICALHNMPLRKLVRSLPSSKMAELICIEAGSMRNLGCMFETELIQHYLNAPEANFIDALRLSQSNTAPANSDTI